MRSRSVHQFGDDVLVLLLWPLPKYLLQFSVKNEWFPHELCNPEFLSCYKHTNNFPSMIIFHNKRDFYFISNIHLKDNPRNRKHHNHIEPALFRLVMPWPIMSWNVALILDFFLETYTSINISKIYLPFSNISIKNYDISNAKSVLFFFISIFDKYNIGQ